MRELRKQALESHKKPSRKSLAKGTFLTASGASTPAKRSPQTSKVNSPAMSRVGSQAGSRDATDTEHDEEEYLDDGSMLDEGSVIDEEEMSVEEVNTWEAILKDRIQEIIEWKRSSTAGREQALQQYVRILQHFYAVEEIARQEQDLLISFLRSVRTASSELEVELALKAIGLTSITSEDCNLFEECAPRVKRTIQEEGPSISTKVAAIRTYCILAACSGLDDEGLMDCLDFFLDIIATDGTSIEAENQPDPVQAAIKAYAVLATFVDDLSDYSADHTETLMDQLDSSFPGVQVEAGMAIALLHEKSFSPPEADDIFEDLAKDSIIRTGDSSDDPPILIRRYQYSHSHNQILEKVSSLASTIGRTRRKDAKETRTSFKYILLSLEDPRKGPHYSTDLDVAGNEFGERLRIKLTNTNPPLIVQFREYSTYAQVTALKSCLQGGFLTHYWQQNPVVLEALPDPKEAKQVAARDRKAAAKMASVQKASLANFIE